MRIIGIDPGTATTGFGIITAIKGRYQLVDAGVIRTPAKTPLPERLATIYENLNELITEYEPQAMAVEELFFAQNTTTAMSVSHARGVVMLAGQQAGLSVAQYTPLQVKQALTGYGRADKQQIQEMVKIMLKLKQRPSPDDAADALAVAITHAMSSRYSAL